jgi:hypothetical protein
LIYSLYRSAHKSPLVEHRSILKFCSDITRAHKKSTEWKLAERQLHIKNAKNYRGITVTPTLSKIIEKILKIRENGKIILNQNPLQKGFTENSSPLLCELLVEEFERQNKDLKRPTCIATTSTADFASNIAMHVGLLRSLFCRSNSSTSNSQRSGDEFSVNTFCSGF